MTEPASRSLWERLSGIQKIDVRVDQLASGRAIASELTHAGLGKISVSQPCPTVLIFQESGHWIKGPTPIAFSNHVRWERITRQKIQFTHLRYGTENPVNLVEFHRVSDLRWEGQRPYLCGDDCYSGRLSLSGNIVSLVWKITGPAKNQRITCNYS